MSNENWTMLCFHGGIQDGVKILENVVFFPNLTVFLWDCGQ